MRLIGLGAGAHAKVIVDMVRARGDFELYGLLDSKPELSGSNVLGVLVLGSDDLMTEIWAAGVGHAFVGLGSVGDAHARENLFERACQIGFDLPVLAHPQAIVAPSAVLGRGTVVMAGAIVNPGAQIGENVIINTGAVVEHDCVIEDHTHIAGGAVLGGRAKIGQGAHVGLGAVIRDGRRVGLRSIVGAGAVVVADVRDGAVVAGVPARELKNTQT